MKKILFALCPLLFMCVAACAQTSEKVIGVNNNGTYTITATTASIKSIFDTSLKQEGITGTLVNFEIKEDVVEGATEKYFYLIGSTAANDVKIVTLLTLKSDNTFVAKMAATLTNAFSGTCTCSGSCTKGCDPKRWMDSEGEINWRCSKCTQSNRTCNKSVTDS